mmetsp:Transcript_35101/g.83807  ORF Transcript_35101/g.83807 Transcript_35101/m.83807 type:complete len:200 (+) Transcript_35101:1060-1659(+)
MAHLRRGRRRAQLTLWRALAQALHHSRALGRRQHRRAPPREEDGHRARHGPRRLQARPDSPRRHGLAGGAQGDPQDEAKGPQGQARRQGGAHQRGGPTALDLAAELQRRAGALRRARMVRGHRHAPHAALRAAAAGGARILLLPLPALGLAPPHGESSRCVAALRRAMRDAPHLLSPAARPAAAQPALHPPLGAVGQGG